MGSALSTARMVTRLGDFLDQVRYFNEQIRDLRSGKLKLKDVNWFKWVMNFVDFWSGIFDNWVYLVRVGLTKYKTKW